MQSIRILARRINPKLFKRAYRPSLVQQGEHEAEDAKEEYQDLKDYTDEIASQDEIAELFHEIDANGDGKLSQDDLVRALRKGKLPTSHTHMEKLFREIDTKKTGTIDLGEFTVFIKERKQKLHQAYRQILRHRSSLLENHKGFTASTFRVAAKTSGVHLSDKDMTIITNHLEHNADESKYISYKTFVDCLLLAPEINPRYFLDSWYTDAFCDDAESQFTLPREIRLDDQNENPSSFVQAASKKLGCGGLAGALSRTMTAPIDRVRVLMMTTSGTEPLGMQRAIAAASTGGYTRLWMGNGVNCLKIAPEVGIKLLAFDSIKNKIAQDPTNVSVAERFFAGGAAGMMAQMTVYPLETLKTRLSGAAAGETLSMTECARKTIAQGGYRALYAGLGPSIVGIIPYAAIDLSLNSVIKEHAAEYLQQAKQESSVPLLLGCGMASSGTAAVLTFPLNVIRTKAQVSGDSFGRVVQSLQSQGWRSFYRGLVPCLAKVLPATSISYAAYEYLGGAWDKTTIAAGNH
mmetsp:Transcript_28122/g.46569  ORF Transcript_28122/g.46569 Transcript_28122/m.46569 type:complete len:519 (-) Transcript_28122:299-1855(-)|eukprot:CAMPEP_0119017232 /NCGR_PEP_ID=MMETSP1176-20130426/15835_1 /TAXON_ID=265551 /ORGANISM="Synedropsis recta cf, Strain CCMP1620" /LENGTH=518 /DNA_ID=CAMNT_0006970893 /DNA_START=34 /DNA_END=1590 /DNA_ORIENTATION=-